MRSLMLALVILSGCAATNRGGLFCDSACVARNDAAAAPAIEARRRERVAYEARVAAQKAEQERLAAIRAEELRRIAERQALLAAEDARRERFCLAMLKSEPEALRVAAGESGADGPAVRAGCLSWLQERETRHQEQVTAEHERQEAAREESRARWAAASAAFLESQAKAARMRAGIGEYAQPEPAPAPAVYTSPKRMVCKPKPYSFTNEIVCEEQ